jgi:DNA-binding HxlR family transcriptional regulator
VEALILYFLAHEGRRYGALRRCLPGVSDKMLIQQLKELQAGGVVERTDHKEAPPAWTMRSRLLE